MTCLRSRLPASAGLLLSMALAGCGLLLAAATPAHAQAPAQAPAPAAAGAPPSALVPPAATATPAAPAAEPSALVRPPAPLPAPLSAPPAEAAPAAAPASASAAAPATPAPAAAPSAAAASAVPAPPPPPKRVQALWLDDRLGPDPEAWRYSAALDLLGAAVQAEPLRRVLLQRQLAQLRGETPDTTLTVRQAIGRGQQLYAPEADPPTRVRWAEAMTQHLRAVLPGQQRVPVPPELEVDAQRMQEAAPGLWSLYGPDKGLRARIWVLTLANGSRQPLALADFRALPPAISGQLVFDCSLPRYAESAVVLPGQAQAYLCRANAGAGTPQAFDDLARALRSQLTLAVRLEPADLAETASVLRVYSRLEALQRGAAEPLVAQADEQAARAAVPGAVPLRAATAPAPAAAARGEVSRLRWVVVGLVALVAFSVLAGLAGRRAAVAISWVLLTVAVAAIAFGGLSSAWNPLAQAGQARLPMAQAVLAVLLIPGLVTLALTVLHEVLFGERIGLLRGMADWLADAVVDPLVDRLFSGRR